MNKYLVASIGSWNKDIYKKETKSIKARWFYAGNINEFNKIIQKHKFDFIFFLHWRWIVPQKIVKNQNCICFHMTDLPYGRGGSPLQNLILRGHKETKLTAFVMNNKLDAGDILLKRKLSLKGSAHEIYIRTSKLSWKIIKTIIHKKIKKKKQEGKVEKFRRRAAYQSEIPKNLTISEIYDFIRMLDAPEYPLAHINYGTTKIYFKDANYLKDKLVFTACIKK